MEKVVIVGGDAAGMSAAAQATRGARAVEVVVFERSTFTSVAAAGLPYVIGGLVEGTDSLIARTPAQHRANGIDVRLETEVVRVDPDERVVEVHSVVDGRRYEEPFDHLVMATGASPIRPALENIDADGVLGIQTIPEALMIDRAIRSRQVERVVVVGGGYIGVEMAESLIERGLQVTLVERLDAPMASLDPDMGQRVAAVLADMGVKLHLGVGVDGFSVGRDGWVDAVVTEDGVIAADLVVMGLGVRPSVHLAAEAGVVIGATGAIATDARMQTSIEDIWAAGDCAESFHRVSCKPSWVALGTHANKHGRVVGLNVSGTPTRFPGLIGTAMTKIGEMEVARTGLSCREAHDAGFEVVERTIEGETIAGYYPGAATMAVKVIAERGTGRMLGAQIVGGPGSGKRIDALAVAVWNAMTADEFSQLDLGYAPPFSPVWDPTLVAARLASTLT